MTRKTPPEPPAMPFTPQDALEFMQKMWNPLGVPIPGFALPGTPGALPFPNPATMFPTIDPVEVRQAIGIQRHIDAGSNAAKTHCRPQPDVVPRITVRGVGQCINHLTEQPWLQKENACQQQITQRQGYSQPLFGSQQRQHPQIDLPQTHAARLFVDESTFDDIVTGFAGTW